MTDKRTYVTLGKTGDILAVLPLIHHEIRQKKNSTLMVSNEYADVLEGCAWLSPIIYNGPAHHIDKAMEMAQSMSKDVQCLQVAGPPDSVKRYCYDPTPTPHATTGSFIREMWKLAGAADLWREQPPLIFNNRDKEREKALLAEVRKNDTRKLILVANQSQSSPFFAADLLWKLIHLNYRREYKVVNMSEIKAERFYDLLALYEVARCLITIDTAPLHLAPAVAGLPVVAIVNDGWKGSPWRPNHIFHCRYSDWPTRATEMLTAIDRIDDRASWFFKPRATPKVIHVWNEYQGTIPTPQFDEQYRSAKWVRCPIELKACGRDSRKVNKDVEPQPFIKDMLNVASMRATDNDVICLTRTGTDAFNVTAESLIADAPCWAHRSVRDKEEVTTDVSYHPASDLFAFTKKFWVEHEDDLPDVLCSHDWHWSRVLQGWLAKHGGKQLDFAVVREPSDKRHTPNEVTNQNEALTKNWFIANKISLEVPKVIDQIPCNQINRKAVSPFGYNGSVGIYNKQPILIYRWHRDGPSTYLAIAELDRALNVRSNHELSVPGKSVEDPKTFMYQDKLWTSYIESTWPDPNPVAIVRYGQVVRDNRGWRIEGQFMPNYGQNDGTGLEKNFVFYSVGERLFCIYKSQPEQIVIELEGSQVLNEWRTPVPHWRFGERKGGCVIEYKDHLLRFFHSTLDNEPAPWRRRYYIGYCLMEKEQPFKIVKIAKAPLIRGSEVDDLNPTERSSCRHYKPQVVFPTSVIAGPEGGWFLSLGVNDSHNLVARVTEKHLNFA